MIPLFLRMNFKEINWLRKSVYRLRNWQNKHSYSSGKNNRIVNNKGINVGSRIQIIGNGNQVIFEKGCVLLNSLIRVSGNFNIVRLEANCYISNAELWVENDKCSLIIGERTFVGDHSHLACTEDGCQLIIGADGMISSYVQIRTGDSHSILNMDGNRINPSRSVSIGNHCWIGEGAKVLKGVSLEGNNIVSTGAIVTKSFPRNVMVGGVPAKVLKENINWDKRRI